MTFRNSILAGDTLIREAIRSQDYDPGVAGWTVNADGSAEFNDVVIRGGTVVSGTALYYDGTPGPGTLFLAISAEAGTDEYGNVYGAGLTCGPGNMRQIQLVQDAQGGYILLKHNDAEEVLPGFISTVRSAGGTPQQRLISQMASAHQSGGGAAAIQLVSGSVDGTILPSVALVGDATTNDTVLLANQEQTQVVPENPSTNSTLYVEAPAGHTGRALRVTLDGTDAFTVDPDGTTRAAGSIGAANLRSGTANTAAPGAGGGVSTVNVVFAEPMNGVPAVTLTPRSAADPSSTVIRGYADNVTESGFTIRAYRSTNSLTIWSYTAIAP